MQDKLFNQTWFSVFLIYGELFVFVLFVLIFVFFYFCFYLYNCVLAICCIVPILSLRKDSGICMF